MNKVYIVVKNILDLIMALTLLLLLWWLLGLIILTYLLIGQTQIFFVQRRIGKHDNIFKLYKFKTLKTVAAPLAQRRFWLGNFLRLLSLDELPQLINVLRGEMSLVGPRPLPEEYLSLFSAQQRRRHEVLPGITGLAQVCGRNNLPWKKKFEMDVHYVDHISFALDLRIIVKTIVLILSFKKDTSLDEQKFTGSNEA